MTSCFCRLPSCRPAVYEWTCGKSGNLVRLCVACCADWRAIAVGEPDLAPRRIRQMKGSR